MVPDEEPSHKKSMPSSDRCASVRVRNGHTEKHKKRKGVVMRLDGKRVVVIGGSSGIGLETARLALSLGAYVTIAGRSEDRLSRAAATLKNVPDRLRTVVADMADGQSIQSLFSGESQVDHGFVPARGP